MSLYWTIPFADDCDAVDRWDMLGSVAGGVGSILSLLIAGAALVFAFRANTFGQRADQRAEDDRRERDLDQRRDLASKVCCYLDKLVHVTGANGKPAVFEVGIMIINLSGLPIYDVRGSFHPIHSDGTIGQPRFVTDTLDVFAPGQELKVPRVDLERQLHAGRWAVSMEFRDPNNRVWRRDPDGRLTEIGSAG